jgi:hypothetical protein
MGIIIISSTCILFPSWYSLKIVHLAFNNNHSPILFYHGDQFQWWKKPEYPERTIDHGQATGKLYHLQLRVECTFFCNLQNRAQTHFQQYFSYILVVSFIGGGN